LASLVPHPFELFGDKARNTAGHGNELPLLGAVVCGALDGRRGRRLVVVWALKRDSPAAPRLTRGDTQTPWRFFILPYRSVHLSRKDKVWGMILSILLHRSLSDGQKDQQTTG
jgi:hypothetical protein